MRRTPSYFLSEYTLGLDKLSKLHLCPKSCLRASYPIIYGEARSELQENVPLRFEFVYPYHAQHKSAAAEPLTIPTTD